MRVSHLLGILAIGALSACGGERRPLHDLRSFDRQPEEFSIVPNKPLETPETLAALPTPTPGGGNRADQTPLQDAVAAVGGNPARMASNAGPVDGGIVNAASRFGRDPNVRADLAAEDAEFRKRRSRFTWQLFPKDQYNTIYRRQSTNPYGWLRVFRNAGARTPTAPPER